jgi:hypothetical protein
VEARNDAVWARRAGSVAVTHLLHVEHGPWGVFARGTGGGRPGGRRLAGCFFCLSLWMAAPVAWWLAASWTEVVPPGWRFQPARF